MSESSVLRFALPQLNGGAKPTNTAGEGSVGMLDGPTCRDLQEYVKRLLIEDEAKRIHRFR